MNLAAVCGVLLCHPVRAVEPMFEIVQADGRTNQNGAGGYLQAEIVNRNKGLYWCSTTYSATVLAPIRCVISGATRAYPNDQFAVTTVTSKQDHAFGFSPINSWWHVDQQTGTGEACLAVSNAVGYVCTPLPAELRQ